MSILSFTLAYSWEVKISRISQDFPNTTECCRSYGCSALHDSQIWIESILKEFYITWSCYRGDLEWQHCPLVPQWAVWACGSICRAPTSYSMDKATFITDLLLVVAWLKMVNFRFTWLGHLECVQQLLLDLVLNKSMVWVSTVAVDSWDFRNIFILY